MDERMDGGVTMPERQTEVGVASRLMDDQPGGLAR